MVRDAMTVALALEVSIAYAVTLKVSADSPLFMTVMLMGIEYPRPNTVFEDKGCTLITAMSGAAPDVAL